MTDTITEMPAAVQEQVDKISETTKKGFDLSARLKNRGLRKATITLFLEDEKGLELGWDRNFTDQFNNIIAPDREGIIGKLAVLEIDRAAILAAREAETEEPTGLEEEIAKLTTERDKLTAELTATAIVVKMRAVPPIIQKDTRRQAKATLGITEKNVPEDKMDEFSIAQTAHLMMVMFQSVTDNASGETNTGITFDEAIALMDYLPSGQYERLDTMMGQVQLTDSISRSIEGQEDFS